jgi:hypothetical protein
MSSSNPLYVAKASCADFDVLYKDEVGAPEAITSDTFTVGESSAAAAFAGAELSIGDGPAGILHVHLPAASVALLRMGNVNWVRIKRTFTDGCVELSLPIWIAVQ